MFVIAMSIGGSHPVDAVPLHQCRELALRVAMDDHQLLAQLRQLIPQCLQGLHQEALPLRAQAPQVAPGSEFAPAVHQQQLLGTRLCQQTRVVLQSQVVLEPVECFHVP